MSPVAAREFPDREALFSAVQGVLAQYSGTAVTLRQLYYRLVAAGAIPNNLRAYKNVGAALTEWRRSHKVPMNALEDRTRGMDRFDKGQRDDDPKGWLRSYAEAGVRMARAYKLARWYDQPERVIVAVEKQALEGPFAKVCRELAVDLAVCRGYPSISFLNEIAGALAGSDPDRNHRNNVILYFGDLDPSGLNIPETVEKDLGPRLFRRQFEFERIALTDEQAAEMELIPAPVKMGDSRTAGFVAEHGEEVFELDAIDPHALQELIRTAVGKHFDHDIADDRDRTQQEGRKQIEKLLTEAKVLDFLQGLGSKPGATDPPEDAEEDEDDDSEDGEE